ncbi:hypothetical protein [Lentzea aerocolonigenes]|uniref:hypothetical protein n=1 Tax=Lentzea aerocolonigenes TaxID=68170 RepID=UPI0006976DA8|nr:hypothetical protein [Lentzea aerocolonigenes]
MNRPAADALREAWSGARRAGGARLRWGRGRTGTAQTRLADLDRVPAAEAVETPWQRRHVARFEAL